MLQNKETGLCYNSYRPEWGLVPCTYDPFNHNAFYVNNSDNTIRARRNNKCINTNSSLYSTGSSGSCGDDSLRVIEERNMDPLKTTAKKMIQYNGGSYYGPGGGWGGNRCFQESSWGIPQKIDTIFCDSSNTKQHFEFKQKSDSSNLYQIRSNSNLCVKKGRDYTGNYGILSPCSDHDSSQWFTFDTNDTNQFKIVDIYNYQKGRQDNNLVTTLIKDSNNCFEGRQRLSMSSCDSNPGWLIYDV